MTIAASGAHDSTKGCFISKSHHLSSEPIPYFSNFQDTFESGCFYIHQVFDTALDWTPLSKRGWAFQEWRLSRRIVHFTEGGVRWQCKELQIDEYDAPRYSNGRDSRWDVLLSRYSRTDFTHNGDRLIAIQGIAMEMQIARNDHYYFGIWTADLPEQLLWMRVNTFVDGIPDTPSWSWASKLGHKFFWSTMDARTPMCRGIRPETISIEDSGMMKIRDGYLKGCTISESTVPCSSYNSQARLKNARMLLEHFMDEDANAQYLHALENPSGCPFGVAVFDVVVLAGEPSPDLYCLFVMTTTAHFILETSGEVRTYQTPSQNNPVNDLQLTMEKDASMYWTLILQLETGVARADAHFRRVGMGVSLARPEDGQWNQYPTINII